MTQTVRATVDATWGNGRVYGNLLFLASDNTVCQVYYESGAYKFKYASSPSSGSWSAATTIATTVYHGFDGLMVGDDIWVVYHNNDNSNQDIVKLTKSGSTWTLGTSAHVIALLDCGNADESVTITYDGAVYWVCGPYWNGSGQSISACSSPDLVTWTPRIATATSNMDNLSASTFSVAHSSLGYTMMAWYANNANAYYRVHADGGALGTWTTEASKSSINVYESDSLSLVGIESGFRLINSRYPGEAATLAIDVYDFDGGSTWSAVSSLGTTADTQGQGVKTGTNIVTVAWPEYVAASNYRIAYNTVNASRTAGTKGYLTAGGLNRGGVQTAANTSYFVASWLEANGANFDLKFDYVAATSPDASTGLTATGGAGSLALAWTPGYDGGSAITDYVAQYSLDNVTWSTWSHTASTTPAATITGLASGTLYYLRVAEVNAIGTGAYGTTVTATTFAVPSTPSAPVAEVSHLGSHLTFTLPASDSPITGATARYSSNSGSTWTTSAAVMTYAGELSVTGLVAGTSYIYGIKVTSAVGDSAWSANSAAATPVDLTGVLLLEDGSKLLLEDGSSRLLLEAGAGSGGSPQTTTAQIGVLVLSGVAGASTPGAATKTAQPATLALTGVQGTSTTGGVTKAAQVAAIALVAVQGTSSTGAAATTAQVATITLTGVQGASSTGAVATTAQSATVALAGVQGASAAGAVITTAQPATLTLSAVQGTSTSGQTTTAQVAALTLNALAGTSTTGGATKTAQVATLALTGVQGTSSTGAVSTTAQVASIALSGVQGMSTIAGATVAQPATLALSGVQGTSIGGAVTKTAQVASISLTAVQGVSRVAGATVAQPATLALSAVPGASTAGSMTTTAQAATISLTAVQGTATVGPASTVAQPAALVLTAAHGVSTTGPTTSTAQVASISLLAVGGTSTNGPVSTVSQVGGLTLVAVAGTSLAGAVAKTAQVATITLTAVPGASTGGTVATGGVVTLTFSAPTAGLALSAPMVAVSFDSATASLNIGV